MFVITADQIDSRNDIDRAGSLQAQLNERYRNALALLFDQTSGDELQAATDSPAVALDVVLELTRTGHWSVGLGVGAVRTPLPDAARKATGPAFVAARNAVEVAKRADARFALHGQEASPDADDQPIRVSDVEPLVTMLLLLRARRTGQGWEAVDLLTAGHNQQSAAALIGISPAAVSQRLKVAMWSVEEDARPALIRLLEELDRSGAGMEHVA
ncbi:DNA-binding protein [Luethyella okanaganae]|uniref:DNA-binding protein n=1 Tax=Luethyella okanaganae TaxID=69372 RepID=A0ABW1VJZ3_9MICO